MSSLIGFGRWSPYYYYILIMNLAKFLKEDILGFNVEYQVLIDLNINHHSLMILLLGFISDFIISLLLDFFLRHRKKLREKTESFVSEDNDSFKKLSTFDKIFEFKDNKSTNKIDDDEKNSLRQDSIFKRESTNKYYLIHNDIMESITQNSFKFIPLSAFLIVVKECITKILYTFNDIFDYYFLNLIILAIILSLFFKQKLYKHQFFSIFFVSLISGTFLICCIFVNNNSTIEEGGHSFTFTFKDRYYYIFILLIIYIIISILFCTGIIFQKNLMELKFISSYKLLFYKGMIGILLTTIALIISTNIPCNELFIIPEKPEGDEQRQNPPPKPSPGPPPGPPPDSDFYPYNNDTSYNYSENNDSLIGFEIFSCFIKYENETYFDNFYGYFQSLSRRNTVQEIFILLAYFILHFISELSLILVNKFLTPIHYLISESFYTLIHLLYQIITNKFNPDPYHSEQREENSGGIYNSISQSEVSRILKFIACFFEFIGYMIFMEIIYFNFCGLSRDISKNIEKRAKLESIILEKEIDKDYDNEESSFDNSLSLTHKK